MDTITILLFGLIAAAAVLGALVLIQQRRSRELQEHFGPEYERAVNETGDRRKAEEGLAARQKRVEALNIHPLPLDECSEFSKSWRETQAHFVDDPSGAIRSADRLVAEVMEARGYPAGDFEQRTADVSVYHPSLVENYRAAHRIAEANAQGQASTEDLRMAMVRYRSLFDDLLETQPASGRLVRELEWDGAEAPRQKEAMR